MERAEKRRIRDRRFIPYIPATHFVRAYALSKSLSASMDLFPPVSGYRPFNANSKRTYTISIQRQQSDWSKQILERDGHRCQKCGVMDVRLEAHHIWPQGGYPNLRYLLKNGIALCHPCHDRAYHAMEISPGQFAELTRDVKQINSIVEAEDFWDYYTAGLEKGRVVAYGLATMKEISFTAEQLKYFLSWATFNNFVERSQRVVTTAPIKDDQYVLSPDYVSAIESKEFG